MADPLPDGCPWSGWTPPNVDWCEEELCSWVVNPADTWSNLAYVLFGVLMWREARRSGNSRVALFGPASLVVGAFSFVYHASYTYFFQFFDFVGMFIFCFTVISANAVRLAWVDERKRFIFFAAGVAGFSILVPIMSETRVPIQSLVALLIAFTLFQEFMIVRRRAPDAAPIDYRPFAIGLLLLAIAAGFSLADVTRVFCDPNNHWIQGHAIWHLSSAACLYAFFHFYLRLPQSEQVA